VCVTFQYGIFLSVFKNLFATWSHRYPPAWFKIFDDCAVPQPVCSSDSHIEACRFCQYWPYTSKTLADNTNKYGYLSIKHKLFARIWMKDYLYNLAWKAEGKCRAQKRRLLWCTSPVLRQVHHWSGWITEPVLSEAELYIMYNFTEIKSTCCNYDLNPYWNNTPYQSFLLSSVLVVLYILPKNM
jgi:hypothetical protein